MSRSRSHRWKGTWWADAPKGRLLAATLFMAAAGWLVTAVGWAAVLRSAQPVRALAFTPWDARAASRSAERTLAGGRPDAATLRQAGALARASLRRDPTVVSAWRTLGLTEAGEQRRQVASSLFRMAERLSRRDLPTQLWLIEERVEREDIPGALRHYDTALRTNPGASDILMPILVAAAGAPQTAVPLGRLLATRPSWSGNYYYRLSQAPAATAPDPALVVRMLRTARAGGPLANPGMLRELMEAMVERGAYRPALSVFAILSGRVADPSSGVRDGGFESAGDYPPIDWSLAGDTGLGAEIRSGTGGHGGALVAYASTDRDGTVARQLLLLAPGAYRLRYSVGREHGASPSRLQWRIACAGAGADRPVPLDHPIDPTWGAGLRDTGFRVPAGCPAQWLSLDIGSTDPEGAEAWIDDVAVARVPG